MNSRFCFVCLSVVTLTLLPGIRANAEVTQTAPNGFQVKQVCVVPLNPKAAYQRFVQDFSKWYDASHSYSMNANNLSLDLGQRCMLEKLPEGGFVRHMEIVFHQPGKLLRMTGGLGPLQGMGVNGAWTVQFEEFDGKTKVTMTYVVSGAEFLQLDKLAGPVDGVLGGQLSRFQKFCEQDK